MQSQKHGALVVLAWPTRCMLNMTNEVLLQQALEALEAMQAEFRMLDLPYGSKAYTQANSVRLDIWARLRQIKNQDDLAQQQLQHKKSGMILLDQKCMLGPEDNIKNKIIS